MALGRAKRSSEKTIDKDVLAESIARAIAEGDHVAFRTIFLPFSPGRSTSSESFDDEKYSYLLPTDDQMNSEAFVTALEAVREPDTWAHIEKELEEARPPQLPAGLVSLLADNAIALGKYTSASQSLEMLRTRGRMQDLFFEEGDSALDRNDIPCAVRAYRVGSALEYDYSAFPEPLPAIPRYQERALILHGRYPRTPQETLAGQPYETCLTGGMSYLLNHGAAAARLESRSEEMRTAFLKELIYQSDASWETFRDRFLKASALAREFGERLTAALEGQTDEQSLEDEVAEQLGGDPKAIPETLLGRAIPEGEWWQYLKDLAYEHPASVLFISRLRFGPREILVPRVNPSFPIVQELGLFEK